MEQKCAYRYSFPDTPCPFPSVDSCLWCGKVMCKYHTYRNKHKPRTQHHYNSFRFCSAPCIAFFHQETMRPDREKRCRRCDYPQTCLAQKLCFACIPGVFSLYKTKLFLKELKIQFKCIMKRDFPSPLPLPDLNSIIYSYAYNDFCSALHSPLPLYPHLQARK